MAGTKKFGIVERLLKTYRRSFLVWEWVLSAFLAAAIILWIWTRGWNHVVWLVGTSRGALYGTLASISGALLGFIIAAVSILLALTDRPELEVVESSTSYTKNLYKVFISAIRVLGCTTLAMILGVVADSQQHTGPTSDYIAKTIFSLAVFAVILGIFRVWRCAWALGKIIELATQDKSH